MSHVIGSAADFPHVAQHVVDPAARTLVDYLADQVAELAVQLQALADQVAELSAPAEPAA